MARWKLELHRWLPRCSWEGAAAGGSDLGAGGARPCPRTRAAKLPAPGSGERRGLGAHGSRTPPERRVVNTRRPRRCPPCSPRRAASHLRGSAGRPGTCPERSRLSAPPRSLRPPIPVSPRGQLAAPRGWRGWALRSRPGAPPAQTTTICQLWAVKIRERRDGTAGRAVGRRPDSD